MPRFSAIMLSAAAAVWALFASCERSAAENANVRAYAKTSAPAPASGVSGRIEESRSLDLSFATATRIVKVHAKQGDYVRKGQLLAEGDSSSFVVDLRQAEQAEQKALDDLAALKKKYAGGQIPREQQFAAENALHQAQTDALMARRDLQGCRIVAPFDGYLSAVMLGRGDICAPQFPLGTIDEINTVYAVVNLPMSQMSGVGATKRMDVTTITGRRYAARVAQRQPASDASVEVRLLIDNPDHTLLPGAVVTLAI